MLSEVGLLFISGSTVREGKRVRLKGYPSHHRMCSSER
jgi:hypothetical protein